MNKEAITISAAIVSGALSRGATASVMEKSSNTVKLGASVLFAVGFGYLATRVTGSDTKAAAMRGGALGVAVAQGLEAIKFGFSTPTMQARIASNKFLARTAGLGSPMAGYIDAQGNYREDGLNGYIDAQGNFVEDGMAGYYDENGNYIADEMNGYYDENGTFVEEQLGGYIDENGDYVDSMGVLADENGAYALNGTED